MGAALFWTGFVLCVIGLPAVLIAVVVGVQRRADAAELRRFLGAPVSPVRGHPGGSLVKVRGVVAPGDRGVLVAPAGGDPVVWFRADAARSELGQESWKWIDLFTVRGASDFFVDDGSGERAHMVSEGAGVVGPLRVWGGVTAAVDVGGAAWTRHDMTPEVEAWVTSQSGATGTFRVMLWSLAPGDTVAALGWAERAPTGELVLRDRSPAHPLVLYSGLAEADVARDFQERARNRLILFCVGALLVGAGLTAIVLSAVLAF